MQHDCTPRRSPYSYTEDRNSQKEMALSARNIDGTNSFVRRSNNYDEAVMAAMIRPGPPYILSGPSPVTRFHELRAVTASRQLLFAVDGADEHEDAADDHNYHHVKKKRRLTTEQVKSLEKSFEMECKLEPLRKTQLAQELGLQPRQVAIWFQNRRARYKTKLLEQDYSVLKKQYDDVCLEKEKLQAEVTKLSALLEAKKKQPGSSRPCCCELVTSAVKQEEEEEEEKGEDPAAARSEGQGPDDHETRRQAEMEAMCGTDQSEVEDAGSPGGEGEEEEDELEGGGPMAMAMAMGGAMTMEKQQVCGSQVVQQMAVKMEDGYYTSITEEELYYNNYYYTLLGGHAHTQEDDDEVAAIQPHPPPFLCFDWPPSYYPC